MPTYEYECRECRHTFEIFQSMKEDPLKKCPECGKNSLKRLIGTGAGIIFKGSGFYETDYKKTPQNKIDSSKEKTTAEKTDSGQTDKKSGTTSKAENNGN